MPTLLFGITLSFLLIWLNSDLTLSLIFASLMPQLCIHSDIDFFSITISDGVTNATGPNIRGSASLCTHCIVQCGQ